MAVFAPMPSASAIIGDGGEAFVLQQHAESVADVVKQRVHDSLGVVRQREHRIGARGAVKTRKTRGYVFILVGRVLRRRIIVSCQPTNVVKREVRRRIPTE